MVVELVWSIIWGFIEKSNVLDHITGRVVDEFGRSNGREEHQAMSPVVVYVESLPPAPPRSQSHIDLEEWLISPVPGRFILVGDRPDPSLVIAIIFDSTPNFPASISWMPIALDVPVSTSLPANALAGFIASVTNEREEGLLPVRVDSCGTVEGCAVFAVADNLASRARAICRLVLQSRFHQGLSLVAERS